MGEAPCEIVSVRRSRIKDQVKMAVADNPVVPKNQKSKVALNLLSYRNRDSFLFVLYAFFHNGMLQYKTHC